MKIRTLYPRIVLSDVDRWQDDDFAWLKPRGPRSAAPPQGRFNAGQKINAVFVGASTLALAQSSGTPDEQDKCRRDVRRFCHSVMVSKIPSVMRVTVSLDTLAP